VPCSLSIRSDRRLLRRLLQNLVSNAIKYTLTGRVLVGCRRDGERLRIDVYDTGIGIPPDKRRDVFVEFHRLDQGAKVAAASASASRLSSASPACWSIQSRSLRRSIAAPFLDRGSGCANRTRRDAAAEPRIDHGRIAGALVLCVDNDRQILDGMAALLRDWQCETILATDLPEAIAGVRAAGKPPGGLLVDYHLDHGNGIEAVAELRRLFGAEIPAVLITADRSAGVRETARAGAIQVLNKPLKPASLRALMSQWTVHRVAAAE